MIEKRVDSKQIEIRYITILKQEMKEVSYQSSSQNLKCTVENLMGGIEPISY